MDAVRVAAVVQDVVVVAARHPAAHRPGSASRRSRASRTSASRAPRRSRCASRGRRSRGGRGCRRCRGGVGLSNSSSTCDASRLYRLGSAFRGRANVVAGLSSVIPSCDASRSARRDVESDLLICSRCHRSDRTLAADFLHGACAALSTSPVDNPSAHCSQLLRPPLDSRVWQSMPDLGDSTRTENNLSLRASARALQVRPSIVSLGSHCKPLDL